MHFNSLKNTLVFKLVGIVTLHDVIESLVQLDIFDEFQYNVKKTKKYANDYLKQIDTNYCETIIDVTSLSYEMNKVAVEKLHKRLLSPQIRLTVFQLLRSM